MEESAGVTAEPVQTSEFHPVAGAAAALKGCGIRSPAGDAVDTLKQRVGDSLGIAAFPGDEHRHGAGCVVHLEAEIAAQQALSVKVVV